MKKIGMILLAGFWVFTFSNPAGASGSIGLAPIGGISKAVSGTYNTGQNASDILESGTVYGLSFSNVLSRHYWIEVQAFFTYLPFKQSARPNLLRQQVFVLPGIVFSNNLQLGLGPLSVYLPLGVGIYFWKYAVDGPKSDAVQYQGEKMQKMSPGLSTGLGLSFQWHRHFSIFGEARYHYILCKDKFFFGEKFSEQAVLLGAMGIRFLF